MTTINQKEYLKKYLAIGKTSGEKKKKKKKENVGSSRLKIIDDDVDVLMSQEIEEDLAAANEDAPQVVAVIDERPPSLRIDENTKNNLWKPIGEPSDASGVHKTLRLSIGFKLGKQTKTSGNIQNDSRNFYKPQKLKNNNDIKVKREIDSPPYRNKKADDLPPVQRKDDYSPPRKIIRSEETVSRRSSENDTSPPKKKNGDRYLSKGTDSDSSPRRRRNSDDSFPSRRKHTESDLSPPKRTNKGNDSSSKRKYKGDSPPRSKNTEYDKSPPRRRDNHSHSPTRRREKKDDISPPRRKERQTDSSPPRRRNVDNEALRYGNDRKRDIPNTRWDKGNYSPSSKRSRYSVSPSRRKIREDSSPPRRRDREKDISPPRKRDREDMSPPRKIREDSSPPRRRDRERDISPPRKRDREDMSPPRRNTHDNDHSPPRKNRAIGDKQRRPSEKAGRSDEKMKKTLDGKKAGLQSAKELVKETALLRQKEDRIFQTMSAEVSGRNAATVIRSKKVKDLEEEARQLKKEKETKQKYDQWGKGLKQVESQQEKIAEQLHEMSKPLARYADDEDLEKYLKEQEREGDPMLAYIRKKKKKEAVAAGIPEKPMYVGEFMPNRFGIHPGYRWDGVDRSNGYEKKWFQAQNSKKATQEEAFKWSTEDM